PYSYFKKAKICVVSSIKEGFPNVLLQMLALNDRVVSTNCAGGIQDIPGITVVTPNNVQELTEGIKQQLFDCNTNKRALLDKYLVDRSPEGYVAQMFENI